MAERFRTDVFYPDERQFLTGLLQHRDADVREMARLAVEGGDTSALMMLHDALLDSRDDDNAELLVPLMGYAARWDRPDIERESIEAWTQHRNAHPEADVQGFNNIGNRAAIRRHMETRPGPETPLPISNDLVPEDWQPSKPTKQSRRGVHRRVLRYNQDDHDDYRPEVNEDPLEGFERAWQARDPHQHGGWSHPGGSLHKPLKDDYPAMRADRRFQQAVGQPRDAWQYEPTEADSAAGLRQVLGENEYGLLSLLASHFGPDSRHAWDQLHRGDPTGALGLLDMAEEQGLLMGADQVLSDKIRRQIDHAQLASDDAARDRADEAWYESSLSNIDSPYLAEHANVWNTLSGLSDPAGTPDDVGTGSAVTAEAKHQDALTKGRKDVWHLLDQTYDRLHEDPIWRRATTDKAYKNIAARKERESKDEEQQTLRRHHSGTGRPAGQRGTDEQQRFRQPPQQPEADLEPEPNDQTAQSPLSPPFYPKRLGRDATVNTRRRYAGLRSPAGGVVVRGIHYPGGKFIPAKGPEKASHEQWTKVQDQLRRYRRGDGSLDVDRACRDDVIDAKGRVKMSALDNLGEYAHPKKSKKSRKGAVVKYADLDPRSEPAARTREFLNSQPTVDNPDWDFELGAIAEFHPDLAHLAQAAREGDHAALSALLDEMDDRIEREPDSWYRTQRQERQSRRRRTLQTHLPAIRGHGQ